MKKPIFQITNRRKFVRFLLLLFCLMAGVISVSVYSSLGMAAGVLLIVSSYSLLMRRDNDTVTMNKRFTISKEDLMVILKDTNP